MDSLKIIGYITKAIEHLENGSESLVIKIELIK